MESGRQQSTGSSQPLIDGVLLAEAESIGDLYDLRPPTAVIKPLVQEVRMVIAYWPSRLRTLIGITSQSLLSGTSFGT